MNAVQDGKRTLTRAAKAVSAVALSLFVLHTNSSRAEDPGRPELLPELTLKSAARIESEAAAAKAAAAKPQTVTSEDGTTQQVSWQQDAVVQYVADEAHANLVDEDPYPSAKKCAECHPTHYREWAVSPHAYSQMSPVFNCMQNAVKILTNGTNADFCIRCHTGAGMDRGEPITMPTIDRHPVAREGVTCIVCHRINKEYGKGAGRRRLVRGDVTKPIYGPLGSEVLDQVLADPETYGVTRTTLADDPKKRELHGELEPFFNLATPGFCGTCHDVFGPNGFRLEDAFSEYKNSPAAGEGVTCQDCHMGKVPGENGGFDTGPVAYIGNAYTPPRRITNHMMAGPDYSIIHPGIFPHNIEAIREEDAGELETGLATIREWLKYDVEAGWGTDAFESNIPEGYEFPDAWKDQARRLEGRRILNDQFATIAEYRKQAVQVLQAGFKMSDLCDKHVDSDGLHFKLKVWNGTNGHGVPVGFDAERLIYLDIRVWDANGKMLFRSGDLDPNGDIRDAHSFYVHNGVLPTDHQIFNLQTKFVTRNVRGGEREQILPINISPDPLPFLRPLTRPMNVLGRPLGARKHKQNLEVGGHRWAKYHVDSKHLSGAGPYNVSATLRAQMVPVNLVHRISIAGFDYGLTAREVAKRVVEGSYILYHTEDTFDVHAQ